MSGRRLFWIGLPVLLVALGLETRWGFERWMASYHLHQVEALVERLDREGHLGRVESQRGVRLAFGEAVKLLRRAQELDPSEVGIPMARGNLHRLLHRPKAALEAYEVARGLEPRPQVFAEMGHVYRSLGRTEEAREAYESAILLDHSLARELRPYLGRKTKRTNAVQKTGEGNSTPRPEAAETAQRGETSNE